MSRLSLRPLPLSAALGAALLVYACAGGEPAGPGATLKATRLDAVGTSAGIAGIVGQPLPSSIGVKVFDQFDQPLENVDVTMAVTAGGGSATPAVMKTNASGVATTRWTLGTTAGANTATATIAGLAPAQFSAMAAAGPAAQLTPVGPAAITGAVGTAQLIAVSVKDAHDNAVQGATLGFVVSGSAGALSAATAVSGADGQASVTFTPSLGGSASVAASMTGITSPVMFTVATATVAVSSPTSITKTNGDGQNVTVNLEATTPLTVTVKDAASAPVPNIPVQFAVVSGGTIGGGPAAVQTLNDGTASVTFKAGAAAGTAAVTATVQGLPAQTFTLTVQQLVAATRLVKLLGDNASNPAATTRALSIAVLDANNVRVPNVALTFTATTGGGYLQSVDPSIPAGNTITVPPDGSGEAMVMYVMGPNAGGNSVTVSAAGLRPETFNITGTSYATCAGITSYSIGNTVSGTFATGDCVRETNYLNDVYSLSVQTQQIVEFTGDIRFADANRVIGSSVVEPTRLVLAPGTYYLTSGSALEGTTYTIVSSTVNNIDCKPLGANVLTRGIDVSLQFASSGCRYARPTIYLIAGQPVTITMSSTAFDAELELLSPGGTIVTDDNGAGGTNARITYTPTLSGQHRIEVRAKNSELGAYTLRIQ